MSPHSTKLVALAFGNNPRSHMQVMPFLESLLAMMPILGRVALLLLATGVGLHNNGMHVPLEPVAGWLIHVTSPYTDYIASFAMAWSVMPVVVRWVD